MSQPQRSSLATGEVAKRLGITRSTFQNMFEHVPHLYVQKKETRLFPAAYIDAYVAYLRQTRQIATIDSAASFWRTDDAQRVYGEAVARVQNGLSGNALTGNELAGVLGIPYSTVMSWSTTGGLESVRSKRGVLFPCNKVKTAIVWRKPETRKVYAPPTGSPMFMSANDINERVRRLRRPIPSGTVLFGQLRTPGGGRTVPTAYVDALLSATSGAITDRLVLEFNASAQARRIMQEARTEYNRRFTERQESSPFGDGLLTLEDVAWLLGMTASMAAIWCRQGQLSFEDRSGRRLVRPGSLRARCTWALPTSR